MIINNYIKIFESSIKDYHILDTVTQPINNPYEKNCFEYILYKKNWIDTVQWHLEDIIRDRNIDPIKALEIKRKIDASNQDRTDIVEEMDVYFFEKFKAVQPKPNATSNTETPAWAIDRLSILILKIYHMEIETQRKNVATYHKQNCTKKLNLLNLQKEDLSKSISQLFDDLKKGIKVMKMYKQMKMYNDESLNPVLYKKSKL